MAGLKNVGAAPDSDYSLMTVGDTDARFDQVGVTTQDVSDAIAAQTGGLETTTSVNSKDSGLAKIATVNSGDSGRILASTKGAANGVASLSGGKIPAAQLPVIPDRAPSASWLTSVSFRSGSPWYITTSSVLLAEISISYPGYNYQILPFANVETRSENDGQAILRLRATLGSYNVGRGVGTSSGNWHRAKLVPSSNSGEAGDSGFNGGGTLQLWAERQSGTGTIIASSYSATFFALLMPAIY